jgi:hypothetical protein
VVALVMLLGALGDGEVIGLATGSRVSARRSPPSPSQMPGGIYATVPEDDRFPRLGVVRTSARPVVLNQMVDNVGGSCEVRRQPIS